MATHLVRGTDPVLRQEVVAALVEEVLAGDDRALALEDFEIPGRASEGEVGGSDVRSDVLDRALHAASTPPFMTERRVVVLRDIGNLTKDEAAPLVAYLEQPLPTTELVLVGGGGTMPKSLSDALATHATASAPVSEKADDVLARTAAAVQLTVRPDAARAILAHVGNDAGLLPGLMDTLAAVHGAGASVDVDAVTPYLGGAGSVPVWDLTNAIEKGDVAGSLAVLGRLLTSTSPSQPKPMHPLQVLAMLHGQYRRLLRLDDPAIHTNEEAAAALGGRMSPRAAAFRLRQARALGTDGLRQAFDHLARADLDLKGDRAIPGDVVLEILVARLANLSGRAAARRVR